MSEVESLINIPVEHCSNIFGQFDEYAKVIEKTLKVTIIVRDSSVKVIGAEAAVQRASGVLNYLYELSKRGNQITRQNVDYSIAQSFEEKADSLIEIDSDTVCRTIAGRPIKPKTFGQKEYVDAIRDKMIVFGVGPARTLYKEESTRKYSCSHPKLVKTRVTFLSNSWQTSVAALSTAASAFRSGVL